MQQGSETAASMAESTVQSAQEAVSEAALAVSTSGAPHRALVFASKGGRAEVEPPQGSLYQAASSWSRPSASSFAPSTASLPAADIANSLPESPAVPPEVRVLQTLTVSLSNPEALSSAHWKYYPQRL